jgi:hypothetical protein
VEQTLLVGAKRGQRELLPLRLVCLFHFASLAGTLIFPRKSGRV